MRALILLSLGVSLSAFANVREAALRGHIRFLADDLLEGRGLGSRGGELAAKYLLTQLQGLGYRGELQNVSLVGVKVDPATKLKVGEDEYKFAEEFVGFTGAQAADVKVDAEMIFVGYGIESADEKWNDYKGKPEDYRGKILVMLVNDPPATEAEPKLFGGKALTYQGRWTYKYEEAARRGAAGALLLHTDESAGYPWGVVRTSNGSWRFDIARGEGDKTPFLDFRGWVTDPVAQKIFKAAGKDLAALRTAAAKRDFQPVPLGLRLKADLKSELKRVEAPNVIGVLDGKDKKLRDEYVMVSAHWDHLGVGEPDAKGDRIHNGAVDNASGCAAVLEVARQFAEKRPKRSLVILFPTAEEQGLLGSEWYAQHPTVPLEKTIADVNLDALNVLGRTRDMIALGEERTTIGKWAREAASALKLKLVPEPRPEQGGYFRSDHFPLAKRGVPAVSVGSGDDFVGKPAGWGPKMFKEYNEKHYHQPSDEYDERWDMGGMVEEADFARVLAERLANGHGRPK